MIPSAPLGTDAAAGRLGPGAAATAGPSGPAAERRFRFELAAHPGSPAQARRLTRARLTGWSVCEDTCDTAALVISELVTNAIVHTASTHVVCELHDHDDLVRIAVRDEGCAPGEHHPSPRRPEEEHGRGLLLIDALCRAWGAQESGAGLLVWAELPRGASDAENTGAAFDGTTVFDGETAHESETAHGVDGVDGARCDLGWGPRPKPAPSGGPGGSGGSGGSGRPDEVDWADGSGGPGNAGGTLRADGSGHGHDADGARTPGIVGVPAVEGVEDEAAARRHGVGEAFRHSVAQLRHYGLGIGRPRSAGTEWG